MTAMIHLLDHSSFFKKGKPMGDNMNDIKAKVDKAVEQFKESKTGKTVLGEDGKFDREDIDRISQEVKDSKVGKAVFGEDGKFDKGDVERLTEGAKAAVKDAVDKAKRILSE